MPEQDATQSLAALSRLFDVAYTDTGQARKVASFLLAWHNAEENGGWDPTDLWGVDDAIAADMLQVLRLINDARTYPDRLGFATEIKAVWERWRGKQLDAVAQHPLQNAAGD